MTVAFIPYRDRAPKSTDLRVLRDELARVRLAYGRGSSEGLEAWQRLSHQAALQGRPLDGLRRYTADEVERFFAQTIPGPDGHVFWDGGKEFTCNDGRRPAPRTWWWRHHNGPIRNPYYVRATCGEANCVNPEHCTLVHPGHDRRISDGAMLGALQVWATREGRTPSTRLWDESGGKPSSSYYDIRFGTWLKAIRAAGLVPAAVGNTAVSEQDCLAALRLVHERWAPGHSPATSSASTGRRCAPPGCRRLTRRSVVTSGSGARRSGRRGWREHPAVRLAGSGSVWL